MSDVVTRPARSDEMPWLDASSMMPPRSPPHESGIVPRPVGDPGLPWIDRTSVIPPPPRMPSEARTPVAPPQAALPQAALPQAAAPDSTPTVKREAPQDDRRMLVAALAGIAIALVLTLMFFLLMSIVR